MKAAKKKVGGRPIGKSEGGSIYDTVTETIVELLEGGLIPWRTRWSAVRPKKGRVRKPVLIPQRRLSPPISISSGNTYQGVNVLILWASSLKQGYGSPYWGSLRAWNKSGCRVRNGERATRIVRWVERTVVNPETGTEIDESFPVIHPVFNVGQVEGPAETLAKYRIDDPPAVQAPHDGSPSAPEPILWEPAERLLPPLSLNLRWGGRLAFYRPSSDFVQMPDRDRFATKAGLYSVLLHEVGHWTGHPRRLGRDFSGGQDSPAYWFEELIAELTACFVLAALDLPDRLEELPNSAAYLKGHLSALGGDRRRIVKAASQAQKAADYILNGGIQKETRSVGRSRRRRADSEAIRDSELGANR